MKRQKDETTEKFERLNCNDISISLHNILTPYIIQSENWLTDEEAYKTQLHISCSLTMTMASLLVCLYKYRKTERLCHEAWLVKMNDIINGDSKINDEFRWLLMSSAIHLRWSCFHDWTHICERLWIIVFSFFQALKNADEEIDFQTDFVNEIARFVNNPILKCWISISFSERRRKQMNQIDVGWWDSNWHHGAGTVVLISLTSWTPLISSSGLLLSLWSISVTSYHHHEFYVH